MNNLDRNLRFGWWSLLIFLSLGGGLEILHGFKIGWYGDVGNDMRRLMFTLAHAHGTALALVNIAAGLTARNIKGFPPRPSVSLSLIWAGILFPVGFFLGGIVTYGGDPRVCNLAAPTPGGGAVFSSRGHANEPNQIVAGGGGAHPTPLSPPRGAGPPAPGPR